MTIESWDPEALPQPETHRQVAAATGSRRVFPAGRVAGAAPGEPVGRGDLVAQVEQADLTVATALVGVAGLSMKSRS